MTVAKDPGRDRMRCILVDPSPARGIAAPPVAAMSQILPRLRAQVVGFAGVGFGTVIADSVLHDESALSPASLFGAQD